jgi:hypothetical protein
MAMDVGIRLHRSRSFGGAGRASNLPIHGRQLIL